MKPPTRAHTPWQKSPSAGLRLPEFVSSVPSECHATVPKSISTPSGMGLVFVAVLLDSISNFHSPTIGAVSSATFIAQAASDEGWYTVLSIPGLLWGRSDQPGLIQAASAICAMAAPAKTSAAVARITPRR